MPKINCNNKKFLSNKKILNFMLFKKVLLEKVLVGKWGKICARNLFYDFVYNLKYIIN